MFRIVKKPNYDFQHLSGHCFGLLSPLTSLLFPDAVVFCKKALKTQPLSPEQQTDKASDKFVNMLAVKKPDISLRSVWRPQTDLEE